MPTAERGIVFTNDLDGVHFKAPPPLKTTLSLLRGNFSLPEIGKPIGEFTPGEGWRGAIFSKWSILFHQMRPTKGDALKGLEAFRQAAEIHQRQLRVAALSGRERDKHDMTRRKLQHSGHERYFTDLYLNQGRSSIGWKESVVRQLIEEGLNVVHIDDDLRAGLCIARINEQYAGEPRVLVYVLRNLSNHPRLLKKAGIRLPNNLLIVRSFKEAADDFVARLSGSEI